MATKTINHYLVVRIRILTLIGKFPGHESDRITEKLIQSSIVKFWIMTQADFWKTHPDHDPEN